MGTLYPAALSVVKKLRAAGHVAFFAGGWVRDFLMHRPSQDIDIVTDANVIVIQSLFSKTIPVGIQFGIVIVIEKSHQFEVATFRKDQPYLDGRRPSAVDPTTPKEDAQRRDFTINGMFYDPLNLVLYDYVEGQKDLQEKRIRAIGNPDERFLEDRLRMIRAVRYATCLNFSIEAKTAAAILAQAHTLLPAVSIERICQELSKMAVFPHFNQALNTLHRFNLLSTIFPQLKDVSQEEIEKRTAPLPFFPQKAPLIARILELFPPLSLKEKETLCAYLKCSKRDLSFIRDLHHFTDMVRSKQPKEQSDWAQIYAHPHYPLYLIIEASHLPPQERKPFIERHRDQLRHLKTAVWRIQNKTPLLTSEHLRRAGVKNGPAMGRLLKEGERLAINKGIDDPEELLKHLFPLLNS